MSVPVKEKAIRLIQYLKELSRIRASIIRNINDYPYVLWFNDIPKEPNQCYLRAWGPNDEYGDQIWLEVIKYEEPVLDEIPEICRPWVNQDEIYQTDMTPELYQQIPAPVEPILPKSQSKKAQDKTEPSITFLELHDHQDVIEAWERYIGIKWKPWAELHKRWESIQKVYSELFSIYQEQRKLGEEYELIIGIGLFLWKTPTGKNVRRHLVAAKANLSFEASLGKFTVTPSAEGAQLEVELNMLDLEEQPVGLKQSATEGLMAAHDDPWDRSAIDPVLTALANQFAKGEGSYNPEIWDCTEREINKKPIVDYSPALILRKRSAKGLQQVLDDILRQIEDGVTPTPQFSDLCESDPEDLTRKLTPEEIKTLSEEPVFFPLEYNEEQLEIVRKLPFKHGLLVQGPPGTGKSHTIANLICHSLATGKRVLITAKTPRALQVLHEKLPLPVQPLCINLLGSGVEEQRSLEASVGGILSRQSRWNLRRATKEIEELNARLDKNRSEKAEIEFRIRSIREKETMDHSIIDNHYSGSAEKIAVRLKNEEGRFAWFTDSIPYDKDFPCKIEEIKSALKNLAAAPADIDMQINLYFPELYDIFLSETDFTELVNREERAKEAFESCRDKCNSTMGNALSSCGEEDLKFIINSTNKLNHRISEIVSTSLPWADKAIDNIVHGLSASWLELYKSLGSNLDGLKHRARIVDNLSVNYPAEISQKKLLKDAAELKNHFDSGGKTGFFLFKPAIVKQNQYIIDSVTVDSSPCSNTETLTSLIEYLSVDQSIKYCWHLLADKADQTDGPLSVQVAVIEEHHNSLKDVLSLELDVYALRNFLKKYSEVGDSFFRSVQDIKEINDICTAIIESNKLDEIQSKLDEYTDGLLQHAQKPNSHPIIKKVYEIVKTRKKEDYPKFIQLATKYKEAYKSIIESQELISLLSDSAPNLARKMRSDPGDEKLIEHINALPDAWVWARANSWIRSFLNEDDLPMLIRRLEQIDNDIRKIITDLSTINAWKFLDERMKDEHQRHLIAWQQEVKKIGKGTGKHAPKYRRNAKEHLNKCREAIPAWIMPLHRVYETVPSKPGAFDLIIVDEASQCGFDALPLTYLGKQLIVVGDENQISPEAVGINKNVVHHLMNNYLSDFEHRDSFDAESSLFSHCKRRFSRPIVLREHFRCMPEIIQFSNDLCYHATPLIPLKQYPPERLEPVKIRHVQNGHREGSNNRAINKPEAHAIVDEIVNCCNNDIYDGKTLGVIILQGQLQAALIESLLIKELDGEEIERRRLICGNPYSFQGDERDVIFLSMVAAPNQRIGTYASDADRRRFNVAASRAKEQMWLFHTPVLNDLSQNCLRKRLLSFFIDPRDFSTIPIDQDIHVLRHKALRANRQIEKPPEPFESWFELDVALKIAAKNYRVIPQYPVIESKRIDLVIEGKLSHLAVECDGDYWHGPDEYEEDMARQRVLERCGWTFFRVRGSSFYLDPDEALEGLWELLEEMDIRPFVDKDHEPETEAEKSEKEKTGHNNQDNGKKDGEAPKNTNKKEKKRKSTISRQETLFGDDERPKNIQEAQALKPAQIRKYIVEELEDRPNNSCVKDQLGGFILRRLKIRTHGKPKAQFCRKVNSSLTFMNKKKIVKIYKTSKNVRAKLLKMSQLGSIIYDKNHIL